jgi:hypothetical protein
MNCFDQFALEFRDPACDGVEIAKKLVSHLDEVRSAHPAEWPAMACASRENELHTLLLEDPYTRRAFTKPRGYAGDATTLDFVYGHQDVQDVVAQSSEIGRMIFAYTGGASSPARAVRWRRGRIAQEIEATATKHKLARVLSFACGHLREIEFVHPQLRRRTRITAADVDDEALQLVAEEYGRDSEIECRRLSVKDLITGRRGFDCHFDLIYSLGLCDYLSDEIAQRLIAILLPLVAPGGELVVANFTVATKGAAYMEAAMDWWLHYRNADALVQWASRAGPNMAAEVFEDPFGQVAYLTIRR